MYTVVVYFSLFATYQNILLTYLISISLNIYSWNIIWGNYNEASLAFLTPVSFLIKLYPCAHCKLKAFLNDKQQCHNYKFEILKVKFTFVSIPLSDASARYKRTHITKNKTNKRHGLKKNKIKTNILLMSNLNHYRNMFSS